MKRYNCFFIIVLVVSLVTGCAKNIEESGQKRTLRVGMVCEDQSFTRLFQVKHPEINIEIVSALNKSEVRDISIKDKKEKFMKLLKGEKSLDVIITPDDIYQDLIQANQLKPLEGHIQNSVFKLAQLEPVIVEGLKQRGNGVVFGIPMTYLTPMMVYNKTMFSKRGVLIPKKRLTWDEMFLLAKKLKNTDEKNPNYGICMGANNLELAEMYNESSQIYSVDVKTNRLNVSTPEWEEAWTKVVDLIEDKAIDSPLFRIPYDQEFKGSYASQMLKDTGILFIGFGFKEIVGDLQNLNIPAEQKVDWELAPFPMRDARHNYSTRIGLHDIVCIPNQSSNVEDAWKFIEFLSSEDIEKTRVTLKTLPITKKGVNYFEQKTGVNISALYQVKFASSNPKEVSNRYDLYQCQKEILAAILGKKLTVKQGLAEYQKKGNEILSKDDK